MKYLNYSYRPRNFEVKAILSRNKYLSYEDLRIKFLKSAQNIETNFSKSSQSARKFAHA